MPNQLAILRIGEHTQPPTSIFSLPSELLLRIFDFCRLANEHGWNEKRQWYKLLHVCRKWRRIVLGSPSRLKLRLLCTNSTPVAKMLMYSPPLPLIVRFSPDSLHSESIALALQHNDRVISIEIKQWSLADQGMLTPLDKPFPALESLSLHSRSDATHVLPRNFVAPRLRSIFLLFVPISAVSSLLIHATNLDTLTMALIPSYADLPPESLVELMSSLPRLENLHIVFLPLTPEGVTPLQRTHPTRVVLPSLRSFLYLGVSDYLENVLALISTPLLQNFYATYHWHYTCTFPRLSEFLSTVPNLDFRTAEVSIRGTNISLDYHYVQPLSYFSFCIDETYDDQSKVATLVQICRATAPVLPTVQDLVLKSDKGGEISAFSNEQWHAFLQSFGGVRTLRTDIAFAAGLSDAMHPDNGAPTKWLLPKLTELVVVSKEGLIHAPLLSSINARRLAGHHIDFQVIQAHPPRFSHPDIRHTFPLF